MGGITGDIADFCGWSMNPIELEDGVWAVQSRESVHGTRPKLITVTGLATERNHASTGAYSRLNRLRPLDHVMTDAVAEGGLRVHETILEIMGTQASGMLASIQILTSTARDVDGLRSIVQEIFSDGLLPQLPNASVFLIEISETLPKRYQLVRALLPTDEHSRFRQEGGRAFRAAKALFDDTTIGLGSYLNVLVTSMAPNPWGMAVGRPGGVVLYLFGETIPGQMAVAADPIMLFGESNGHRPSVKYSASIPPESFAKAVEWWVEHLDVLLSVATEPANYEEDGFYNPQIALEKLLSLEQFFRDCQSIATGAIDQHASRLIMFSALEILGGLSGQLKWETLTNAISARNVLNSLVRTLPPTLHDVLLPRARAAVDALERLQEGFFLPERLEDEGLRLPTSKGGDEIVPLEKAVSQWLRLIRNSHHGFDKKQPPRSRALLSSHDGVFAPHLPDLAWLYLLHLMAHPTYLQRHAPPIDK